ncbi:MAG: DUF4012 domain-containing protein [Acidimicrobiales bacterium]
MAENVPVLGHLAASYLGDYLALLIGRAPAEVAARAFLAAVVAAVVIPLVLRSWAATWPWLAGWTPARRAAVTVTGSAAVAVILSTGLAEPLAAAVAAMVLTSLWWARAGNDRPAGGPLVRIAMSHGVPFLMAALVVRSGLVVPFTLLGPVDAALSVGLLVGLPAALSSLDRRGRGDAGGPAGVRVILVLSQSAALSGVALAVGDPAVAGLAAAIGGALVAAVANRSPDPGPARMEDAVWKGVGLGLTVATLRLLTGAGAGIGPAVAACLWILPVADALVGLLARGRRRLPLAGGGGGQVLVRLTARGVGAGRARLLVGAVGAAGALGALAAGRGWLSPPAATGLGLVPVMVLLLGTARVCVYKAPVVGLRWPARALVALVVGLPVLALPAAWSAATSIPTLRSSNQLVEDAIDRIQSDDGDTEGSGSCQPPETPEQCLATAQASFTQVSDRLSGPLVSLARLVPVVSPHLVAARTLVDGGAELAGQGAAVAGGVNPDAIGFRAGAINLAGIGPLADRMAVATEALVGVRSRLLGVDDRFLVGPARQLISGLTDRLEGVGSTAANLSETLQLAPELLGGNGPRTYFLAVQNNAEARATGGLIGNFAIIEASGGQLSIGGLGRVKDLRDNGLPLPERVLHRPPDDEYRRRYDRFQPESTWQNVNLSPDFPTVGEVIADLYPQSGGSPVDGVIGIDAVGLAAMMELTGPVSVGEWPEKITAENVVDVTLSQAYEAFATKEERVDFLADVADRVVARLAEDPPSPARMASVLGRAARGRHLSVYLANPQAQRLIGRLGIAGGIPAPVGDSLLVTSQNAGANKVDYHLRRELSYEVTVAPAGRAAQVDGSLSVSLKNGAPSTGLDPYVIGPNTGVVQAGENLSITSVYSALTPTGVTFNGDAVPPLLGTELGHSVYRDFLSVPSHSTGTLVVPMTGEVALEAGGWYRLDLRAQPLLVPEVATISISAAPGWRVAEVQGFDANSGQAGIGIEDDGRGTEARGRVTLNGDRRVRVRLVRS